MEVCFFRKFSHYQLLKQRGKDVSFDQLWVPHEISGMIGFQGFLVRHGSQPRGGNLKCKECTPENDGYSSEIEAKQNIGILPMLFLVSVPLGH